MTSERPGMKKSRREGLLATIAVLGVVMVLCCRHSLQAKNNDPGPSVSGPVRIGVCMSAAGQSADISRLQAEGIRMAWEMEKGRSSRAVELIFRDSGATPQAFSQALQQLIEEDKVSGIISNRSAEYVSKAAQVLKQGAVFLIMTSPARQDWKTEEWPSVVRICASLEDQAYACSRFMMDVVHARRMGLVVDEKDEDSVRLASLFSAAVVKAGGRIEDVAYVRQTQDPTKDITHLMGKKPDAVYVPVSGSLARTVIMKIRSMDEGKPVVAGNSVGEETFLRDVEKSLEGVYIQTGFFEERVKSPLGKDFVSYFSRNAPKKAYLGSNIATGAESYFLMLNIISSRQKGAQKDMTPAASLWKPYLLDNTLNNPEGAVKNRLSFGQVKRHFFGGASLKYVATITVPRSDPVSNVRTQ